MSLDTAVHDALAGVMDPEIKTCSIADLGMIERVGVTDDAIEVDLLPTFAGCPALDVIGQDVRAALQPIAGARAIRVRFVMSPPWTTDRIAPAARDGLRAMGIAPPTGALLQIGARVAVACPYCGNETTVEESSFGPTPCRTIRYCPACRNPFEGFKTKRAEP